MLIDTLPHDDDEFAACSSVDPDLFFPEPGDHMTRQRAVAICRECPLVRSCLTYALTNNVSGIWGATNERQRRILRQRHNIIPRGVTINNLQLEVSA